MTTSHALEAKYEKQDEEATNKPSQTNLEKLPDPTGWRILVMPFQVKEETKGGIIIAQETLDRARAAVQVGYVLKKGPCVMRIKKDIRQARGAKKKIG